METILRLTGRQHAALRAHLFPGDGNETVALALCGRRAGRTRHILTVRRITPVQHQQCSVRTPERVTWSTELLPPLLAEAERRGEAVLKIHSHPGGLSRFSEVDAAADRNLFSSVYGWTDGKGPHASAVMLPDGRIFGRTVALDGTFGPLTRITVAGEEVRIWDEDGAAAEMPDFAVRHAQAFGAGTTAMLGRLSVAVVGCSGTGGPVTEMLARFGVSELVLVDPDRVERKNLNRITNTFAGDALVGRSKVHALADAVRAMGLGTQVVAIPQSLFDPGVALRVAECDVVFGCMDSVDGRDLLNRISAFYLIPYFDVGVRLDADGLGGVDQICGTVHYLQPDGSSLMSRGLYTSDQLQAAALRRADPGAYEERLKEKYIIGVQEDRPAVVSVNTLFAALAVNELLARLHSFRDDGNAGFARFGMSLTQARLWGEADGEPCPVLARQVGKGDVRPPLGMPELSGGDQCS
jgi:hypothetical protein